MQKINICFIDDEPEIYPKQFGGKARTITNLANKLANSEKVGKVTILSNSIYSKEDKFEVEGVTYEKMLGYNCVNQILKKLEENDIVSVHACSFTFPRVKGCRAKVIYNLHDVIFATADAGSHLDKALGNNWDSIVAPSNFARDTLNNVGWWKPDLNIEVIPRGIDSEKFSPINKDEAFKIITKYINEDLQKSSYPVLFFPNRSGCGKGEEYLENLLNDLKKEYIKPLIIVTDDKKTGDDGIVAVDWISSKDMKYFYSYSDATLIFSTLPESFSQVALESITCSTPIVTFAFGNLPNLASEFSTIFLAKPDEEDILKKTKKALEVGNSIKEMNSDLAKEKYSMDSILEIYLSFYQELLEGRSQSETDITDDKDILFNNPTIAIYDNQVYVKEKEGRLTGYKLNQKEQKILRELRQVKSLRELKEIIRDDQTDKDIVGLVNDKIIIRSKNG